MTVLAGDGRADPMVASRAVLAGAAPAPADQLLRGRPRGWWGMVLLILTEATIFAGLLSAYFFIRSQTKGWPPLGIKAPDLTKIVPFTFVLLGSSLPLLWMESGLKRGRIGRVRPALALSWLMGAAFLANQLVEYRSLDFTLTDHVYGSLFYVITGLHGLHVLIGLLMSLVVQTKAWLGRVTAERHLSVEVFALYWHFVDVVWIFVFSSLYLSPHFIRG